MPEINYEEASWRSKEFWTPEQITAGCVSPPEMDYWLLPDIMACFGCQGLIAHDDYKGRFHDYHLDPGAAPLQRYWLPPMLAWDSKTWYLVRDQPLLKVLWYRRRKAFDAGGEVETLRRRTGGGEDVLCNGSWENFACAAQLRHQHDHNQQ